MTVWGIMDNNSQLDLEIKHLKTALKKLEAACGDFMSIISKNKDNFNHRKKIILIQYINIFF